MYTEYEKDVFKSMGPDWLFHRFSVQLGETLKNEEEEKYAETVSQYCHKVYSTKIREISFQKVSLNSKLFTAMFLDYNAHGR